MEPLPTLDAHAHIDPACPSSELMNSGAVLAMSLSLDEAALNSKRRDPWILWGVGCHPRKEKAQQTFDKDRFSELAGASALIGEVGLETTSRVPMDTQLRTFRQVLELAAHLPRLVSIHSYHATSQVLEELRRRPVGFPILHDWFGTSAETRLAVALGCYFSIHSQVARHSKFRTNVPLERVFIETDHGWSDPPAAIPSRIQWVEYLVAAQYKLDVKELRRIAWQNLSRIVRETGTRGLLPELMRDILDH